jgi:hypothetical protein
MLTDDAADIAALLKYLRDYQSVIHRLEKCRDRINRLDRRLRHPKRLLKLETKALAASQKTWPKEFQAKVDGPVLVIPKGYERLSTMRFRLRGLAFAIVGSTFKAIGLQFPSGSFLLDDTPFTRDRFNDLGLQAISIPCRPNVPTYVFATGACGLGMTKDNYAKRAAARAAGFDIYPMERQRIMSERANREMVELGKLQNELIAELERKRDEDFPLDILPRWERLAVEETKFALALHRFWKLLPFSSADDLTSVFAAINSGSIRKDSSKGSPPLNSQPEEPSTQGRTKNLPNRGNQIYEQIDRAIRKIADSRPQTQEEVFQSLDDRDVPIPLAKPFLSAHGWIAGFRKNPADARSWLSKRWKKLGLPRFPRGPKPESSCQ